MQAASVRQPGVDEGLGPVEPPPGPRQHPLDQLLDLGPAQHDRRQLVLTAPRGEDPTGLVDPDLLDLGVLEQAGERAEATDAVVQELDVLVGERREAAGEIAIAVVDDDLVDEAASARHRDAFASSRRCSSSRTSRSTISTARRSGTSVVLIPSTPRRDRRSSRSQGDRGAIARSGRPSQTTRSNDGSLGRNAIGGLPGPLRELRRAVLHAARGLWSSVHHHARPCERASGLASASVRCATMPRRTPTGSPADDQEDLVGRGQARRRSSGCAGTARDRTRAPRPLRSARRGRR